MLHAPSILVVALVLAALLATIWAVSGAVFRVSREAMFHWSLANVSIGVGNLVSIQRGVWPDPFTYLGSDLCFAAAFFALRRGIQSFIGRPKTDREQAALLLLGGAVLAWQRSLPGGAGYHAAIVTVSLLAGYTLLAATREAFGFLRTEFDRRTSALVLLPMAATGLLFVHRVLLVTFFSAGLPPDTSRTSGFGLFVLAVIVVQLLQNVSMAGVVIARLIARVHQLSTTDPLTNVANRRRLEAAFAAEAARLRGGPLSLVVLDIDHFKRLNDTHGHAAGDEARVATARVLRGLARASDCVGRLGGEEFCLLLPGTDAAEAAALAERARQALRAEATHFDGRELRWTASFGVATRRAADESWSEMLRRADEALYGAKRAGRDRVAAWPAPQTDAAPA